MIWGWGIPFSNKTRKSGHQFLGGGRGEGLDGGFDAEDGRIRNDEVMGGGMWIRGFAGLAGLL